MIEISYLLMNKDTCLGEVNIINTPAGEYFEWQNHISLPFWLIDINNWFKERMSPLDRENMIALYECNKIKSLAKLIEITNIVSLSDTIWMKSSEEKLNWNQINPYELSFSRAIGLTALDGIVLDYKDHKRSPEYATVGSYAKKWERGKDGKIQLIKKSREHWSDTTGHEAFSEYYTAQIARALGLQEGKEFVDYSIKKYKNGSFISICKCFTSEQYGFIPMATIASRFGEDLPTMYKLYKQLGQEFIFGMLLVIDALTLNTDRHLGNFGFMIDNNTLKIARMAPIFDNNLALCPKLSIRDREKEELSEDLKGMKPKIGRDFIESALIVMNSRHLNLLKNFIGFKFDRSGPINMREGRLNFLENLVNYQAKKLVKLYMNKG